MRCSCKNSFCSSLDEETRCFLCDHSVRIQQPARSSAVQDEIGHLEIVENGLLMSALPAEDGTLRLTSLIYPGCLVGTKYLFKEFTDFPRLEVKALLPTTKCIVPLKIVHDLYEGNPGFKEAVIMKHIELSGTTVQYVWLAYQTGAEKVKSVWKLLQKYGVKDLNQITYDDMAVISGVSRITVARAMKALLAEKQ